MFNYLKYYFQLTKAILSLAIAFSSSIGFYISQHSLITHHSSLITVFIAVYLLSSGASALNQYLEKKTDKLMNRTSSRPIPAGKISPASSLFIIVILVSTGTAILYLLSPIAALLGLLNLFIYDFVYTPLKYKTNLTLLAGGLVGAIPPLIGWFAAGNEHSLQTSTSIICFSSFMFLWQIPHFIILNIKYKEDYMNAGIISLAGTFDKKRLNLILISWFISTCLISLLFPILGILQTGQLLFIFLLLNAISIIIFPYLVIKGNKQTMLISNIYIHVYLISILLLIFAG